jgi:ferredoxin-NADP reductase
MAELKAGKVVEWRYLSDILATFRLMPAEGSRFPDYEAGQYIALRRDDCRLTKRIVGQDGLPRYVTDLDESGNPKRGPVTHSYSIASAPFETRAKGALEFYVVLERDELGEPGRLTESMFRIDPATDSDITYVNRIVGDFTLPKRANGFASVLWVGTGTGLAPFVAMIKELDFKASGGVTDGVQYTLIHTNRTREELAYHQELLEIESRRRFDFAYIASVSRPTSGDLQDPGLGRGRANNVLRYMLGMPLKEQQDFDEAAARGEDASRLRAALDKVTAPALPRHVSAGDLRQRLEPARTVILTCGNPSLMADIKYIADSQQIHFEKEDW